MLLLSSRSYYIFCNRITFFTIILHFLQSMYKKRIGCHPPIIEEIRIKCTANIRHHNLCEFQPRKIAADTRNTNKKSIREWKIKNQKSTRSNSTWQRRRYEEKVQRTNEAKDYIRQIDDIIRECNDQKAFQTSFSYRETSLSIFLVRLSCEIDQVVLSLLLPLALLTAVLVHSLCGISFDFALVFFSK